VNKKSAIMVLMVVVTLFGSMMAVNAADYSVKNIDSMNGLLKSSSIDLSKDNTSVSVLGGKIKVVVGPVTYSNLGSALLAMPTSKIKINIVTSKYKQIDYILVNGKRANIRGNTMSFDSTSYNISDLSFKKQNNGYYYDASREVSLYDLKNIQIFYKDQADLKINKISKKGQYRFVTIKNIGDADSKANKIGVYVGKKLIKSVKAPALKAGQSKVVKIKIPSKYAKNKKNFKVDYDNKIDEIYEDNNAKIAK